MVNVNMLQNDPAKAQRRKGQIKMVDFMRVLVVLVLMALPAFGAIDAATVWEIRTTGDQENGGGFADLDPGTSVDYADANSPILTLTDGVTGAATITLTSATGGFTSAMVGNVLRISAGTGATLGWFQIVTFNSTNSVDCDRNVDAGGATDIEFKVGGAFKLGGLLDDDFFETTDDGMPTHIKAGTYTIGENVNQSQNGTNALPMQYIGYNASRGDSPIGDDRPLLAFATRQCGLGDNLLWKNLRFTTTHTSGIQIGGNSRVVNCTARATDATIGDEAFNGNANGIWIGCSASSPIGTAFSSSTATFINCYAHDSGTGFLISSTHGRAIGCVADSCNSGFSLGGNYGSVTNSTARGCGTGIKNAQGTVNRATNNILADNFLGLHATSTQLLNYYNYNIYSNNTSDTENVTKGSNSITGDALLDGGVVTGTDGVTDGAGTAFTAASSPFSGVTTDDTVQIVEIGTGATLGNYTIAVVVGDGELTLSRSAGATQTGIDYRIVKGTDFTPGTGSPAIDAASDVGIWTDVTTGAADIGAIEAAGAAGGGSTTVFQSPSKNGGKQ